MGAFNSSYPLLRVKDGQKETYKIAIGTSNLTAVVNVLSPSVFLP
jgi:hypothetical protein